MNLNVIVTLIFEKYNDALAETYNTLLMQQTAQQPSDAGELFGLDKIAARRMLNWFDQTPLEEGSTETIGAYLRTLDDPADVAAMIIRASYICDDGVPDYVARIEHRHSAEAAEQIVQHILQFSWQSAGPHDPVSDDILSVSALLDWLSQQTAEAYYNQILAKYIRSEVPFDLISDSFIQYTLTAARPRLPLIIATLEEQIAADAALRKVDEALLTAMVRIAADSDNEAVFNCVTRCMSVTPQKNLAVACLADLRDPRAIEFLRSWLDRHPETAQNTLLLAEVLNTLRLLGDDISDLSELTQG